MPDGASFCPSCGAAIDAIPVLPLVGESTADVEPDDDGPSRSGRTLLGLVVGVVLVLVVLSTFAGGDDGEGGETEDAASTTSTTRPRPSTTQRPTTTTVPGTPGRLLVDERPALLGLEMLAIADAREGGMIVVDLGTGRQIEIPEPTSPLRSLVWTGEVVLAQADFGILRLGGDAAEPWVPVDVGEGRVAWLDWNGLVGVQAVDGPDGEPAVVDRDGTLRTWALPPSVASQVMRYGGARAVLGDSLVLDTPDGIYTIDPDGRIDRLSFGRVVATGSDSVILRRCDEGLRCELVHVDVTGAERRLPDPPEEIDLWAGGVAPNGRSAWLGGASPVDGREALWVLDGDTWIPVGEDGGLRFGGLPYGGATWASDGDRIAWWDQSRATIEVVDATDPTRPSVEIGTNRGVVDEADMGEVVVLVPRDAVPEALRPPR